MRWRSRWSSNWKVWHHFFLTIALGLIQGYAVALNACLSMAQQVGLQVVMKIHLTKSGQPTRTDFNPIIQSQLMTGRPQFPSLLREVLQSSCVANDLRGSKRGGGVGVGVCGPKALVTSLRNSIANADSTMASKAGGITLHSWVLQKMLIESQKNDLCIGVWNSHHLFCFCFVLVFLNWGIQYREMFDWWDWSPKNWNLSQGLFTDSRSNQEHLSLKLFHFSY